MRKFVVIIIIAVIGYIAYTKIKTLINRNEGVHIRTEQRTYEYGEQARQGEIRYYTFSLTAPWLIRFNVNWEAAENAEQSLLRLTSTPLSTYGLTGRESNLQLRIWQIIYRKAYQEAKPVMKRLAAIFQQIRRENRYNDAQMAYLVLRFIQFIPYRRPGGKFDFFTPARTLADYGTGSSAIPPRGYRKGWNGAGDCDTKTVLQIALLHELGIRSIMFHSFRYSHAMIGINVNGIGGTYKTVNGIRYYFAETTYPNWRLGQLPVQYSDIDFWVPIEIVREEPVTDENSTNTQQSERTGEEEPQGDKWRQRQENREGNK